MWRGRRRRSPRYRCRPAAAAAASSRWMRRGCRASPSAPRGCIAAYCAKARRRRWRSTGRRRGGTASPEKHSAMRRADLGGGDAIGMAHRLIDELGLGAAADHLADLTREAVHLAIAIAAVTAATAQLNLRATDDRATRGPVIFDDRAAIGIAADQARALGHGGAGGAQGDGG